MSDIGQIDNTYYAKRAAAERSSAQDFAQELVKTVPHKVMHSTRDHAPVAQPGTTSPQPTHDVPHMTSTSSWSLPGLTSDTVRQGQLSVVVLPTGITEALLGSRVFGVHLLASTYLSELSTREEFDPEVQSEISLQTMASVPSQSHALVSNSTPDLVETSREVTLREQLAAVMNPLVKSEAGEAIPYTQSLSSTTTESMQASTMLWPESSLRLTRQRDGSAVIWLRDYRMPDAKVSELMNELAKSAMAAGIRLGRIVLNGREVWTSPKKITE